jgi:uncharacterized membrane protein
MPLAEQYAGGFMATESFHTSPMQNIQQAPDPVHGAYRLESLAPLIAGASLLSLSKYLKSPVRVWAIIGGGALVAWGIANDRRLRRFIGMAPYETRSGVASVHHKHAIRIEKSIIVAGSLDNIYRIWRNPENLPQFIRHIKSVREIPGNRSHWIVKMAIGREFQWESEIYNEIPNKFFAWRSMLNADVNHAGSVHFRKVKDSARTEIRVILSYEPPGGALGSWLARISGIDPAKLLEMDLQRFKTSFESGHYTVH